MSQWLQGLATYTGAFYRKYHQVELQGLLLYLANRIKDSDSLDLLVLRELIAKMSGVEMIEELSPEQLEAQAGGRALRAEVRRSLM